MSNRFDGLNRNQWAHENIKAINEWAAGGNDVESYVTPEYIPASEETEKKTRKEQVIAFREHLASGGDLTKVQIRKFMIAVIDRLM